MRDIVGYICATAIVMTMLYIDGQVALMTAAAVAGGLVGVNFGLKGKSNGDRY